MSSQNFEKYPRPFLKWAGGKNKLIQQYIPYLPKKFATYHEPFLGGGAIFFYLYRSQLNTQAFLTDINSELINAYCCVKNNVEAVIQLLKEYQIRHNKDYYYEVRSRTVGTSVERAARLIYLNKTCFNGLYRENSKGAFNVPVGTYKNPKICNPDLLRLVAAALQSVQIEVRPFEAVLNYATPEDFVYFDPPYYPLTTTSNFTAYSRYPFNKDDQIILRDTFAKLARRGVKVMLSNSDCSFIREIYQSFKINDILASRAINSDVKKRQKIPEVLVTSY